MADFWNSPLNANIRRTISENMGFLRTNQAQRQAQLDNPAPASNYNGNEEALNAQQMMAFQNAMMMQMMQMMAQITATLNQYNGSFPQQAMPMDQMLQQLLMYNQGSLARENPAIQVIKDALVVSQAETDASDTLNPDLDEFAVSQADVDVIRTALDNEDITPDQLTGAFQRYFARGSADMLDEVSVLYAKLVDQGIVNVRGLLNPLFLNQIDEGRFAFLSQGLANAGTNQDDGTYNRQLVGWILGSIDSTNEDEQTMAQTMVRDMIQAWDGYYDTEEGTAVKSFLTEWIGIRFNAETGELEPDDLQPFALSLSL